MSNNIVYGLIDPRNGRLRYVGKSTTGLKRTKEHKKLRGTNYYKNNWIRQLLGVGLVYEVEILEEVDRIEDLDESEQFWIGYAKFLGCNLTNITLGGPATYRWRQSAETIEKRRLKLLGRVVPPEQRAQIAASLRGRPSPKKGIPASRAQKEKQAIAMGARPFKDQHGRVYQSLFEAAEAHNLAKANVCNVLKGKRRSTGGLVFEYLGAQ